MPWGTLDAKGAFFAILTSDHRVKRSSWMARGRFGDFLAKYSGTISLRFDSVAGGSVLMTRR